MKSSFGRSFFTAAAILLVAMTILGASFQIKVNQFLTDTTVSGLQQNADTIAELAAAYFNNGGMYNRSFQLNLTVASQVSGADAVVCDSEGNVVLCSDAPSGCEHQGLQLNQAYLQKVIRSGGDTATGVINGLYSDRRYMVSRPILVDGNAGGIVLVSTPANDITQIMNKISNIFLTAALFVVLISVLAVTAFARRESRPLKELAKTANAFGHGDLEARVRLDDDYSAEMEEVAVAFNNMAASLQKSEYRRQEFVANVSHELKTPLQGIVGSAELIQSGMVKPEDMPRFVGHIHDEASRMVTLVEDIIRLSQLDEGDAMPTETVDLLALSQEAVTNLQDAAAKQQVSLSVDGGHAPVIGVRRLLYEVIFNLCDNAIKYNVPDGAVKVQVSSENGISSVTVSDTGIGIAPEHQSRVFERFYRVDKSHSKASGGTGLGLSIVKHAVQYHHGDIRLTSKPGEGTVIRITFPAAAQ